MSKDITGLIFNIQKFSIHDGNGIRTVVFLKGCPLRCVWCCNPESQSINNDILYLKDKCIGCSSCARACPFDMLDIDRAVCIKCGNCSAVCPANAKRNSARLITVNELIREVQKDHLFYRNSKGGVTLSGGEPLVQHEFSSAFLKRCKYLGIHTAIETCGYTEWNIMVNVLQHVDQVFMDLKHMNSVQHKKLTGVGNELILENAAKVLSLGKDTTFRIPLIPGCNDDRENIIAVGEFIKLIGSKADRNDVRVEILPYHRLGENKFEWLDKQYDLKGVKANNLDDKDKYLQILRDYGLNVVK